MCSVLCCPVVCLYVLGSVLCCPLRFPHRNDVPCLRLFVEGNSCLSVYLCVLACRDAQHFVLSDVLTFWVLFCGTRCGFRVEMMFCSSYLQLFVGGLIRVLFTLFVFVCVYCHPPHIVLCFFV
jgi:hypothetical protein